MSEVKYFDVTEGVVITVRMEVMDSGQIELVRETPSGKVIYFDGPEDAIRRWSAWVLCAGCIQETQSQTTEKVRVYQ